MAGLAYPRLTTSTASQFQSPPPRYGDLPPAAGMKANHDGTVQLRCGQGRKIRSEGLLRYKDRIMDGTSSRMMSHGVFLAPLIPVSIGHGAERVHRRLSGFLEIRGGMVSLARQDTC